MEGNGANFHMQDGKRKILIIEDEIINQEILSMVLRDTYEVLVTSTGRAALDLLEQGSRTISLILLDLNLPDMHGLDVLKEIKEDSRFSQIPVIVMTSDADAEVESLSIGATDFITKPYPQPKVILARILRTIELSENRDMIRLTERDQVTGLYNREYFYRYASRYDEFNREKPTDAILVDINHFHIVNDRYGKAYGDQVLRAVGEKLNAIVEDAGGIVCRQEADKFLIYCPHREDYTDILEAASVSFQGKEQRESRIRVRLGVYANADKSIDIERRFDRAKQAADTVKNSVTRTIALYDESMHDQEEFAEQLVEDFPAAIQERQFKVFYQPKFYIRSKEPTLVSAEALVRWVHPKLGMVSPGTFIPLFENNGLIQELDNYVWHEAARQIKEWKDRFEISVPVSVNVSRIDMYDPNFIENMTGIVKKNELSFNELLLEITESAYTEDSSQMIDIVKRLREIGFQVEMDDFGSGYSSLNMISALPIDAIKLDMQFIRNAFKERKDTRLLEVVIQLAESLEVPTIAEGVETAEQLITLKSMGCDIVQGYYFSKPLPANEFEKFVREKKEIEIMDKKGIHRKKRDHFTYDALHDPLTGLYNNTAFEILFRDSDKEHIAVLIADVDNYSKIKEEKGRAYADKLIKHVAEVLRSNFRSVDDICRLREDEFVVIMTRVNNAMHSLVFDKVEAVNRVLGHPVDEEDVPVSLSVGVAFSEREKAEGDIFEDADTALNRMKEMRQCGCAVFG